MFGVRWGLSQHDGTSYFSLGVSTGAVCGETDVYAAGGLCVCKCTDLCTFQGPVVPETSVKPKEKKKKGIDAQILILFLVSY